MSDVANVIVMDRFRQSEETIATMLANSDIDLGDENAVLAFVDARGVRYWHLPAGFDWLSARIRAHNLRAQKFWYGRNLMRLCDRIASAELLPAHIPAVALGACALLISAASPSQAAGGAPERAGEPFALLVSTGAIMFIAWLLTVYLESWGQRRQGPPDGE